MAVMHQTTMRFGRELWTAIEEEADATGVSTAQYVRESVLWRIAYEAGRRSDSDLPSTEAVDPDAGAMAREVARDEHDSATALWAQGRQARKRAQNLREEVRQKRDELREKAARARR